MKEKELQKPEEEVVEEVAEKVVEEVAEVKVEKEVPKGYHLAEVTTQTGIITVKDGKQVSDQELLVKIANAVEKAGLM